jgi:hypothetical protein
VATLAERFEAKVDRSGDHNLWRGATQAEGVGQRRVDGKLTTARRVAWELVHGPLAPGAIVGVVPRIRDVSGSRICGSLEPTHDRGEDRCSSRRARNAGTRAARETEIESDMAGSIRKTVGSGISGA